MGFAEFRKSHRVGKTIEEKRELAGERELKLLVWLPGPNGSPPLSPQVRIAMGCLFRRLQGGQAVNIPRSKLLRSSGTWIYESRIRDHSVEWCVMYRLEHDFIVIGEVLRTRPTLEMPSFPVWKALVSYDGRSDHPEACGWLRGDLADFLGLTQAEVELVDIRLALADMLQHVRFKRGWTQADAAGELGMSHSRVSRMEQPDWPISIDLLVKSLLTLGASRAELGAVIAGCAAP
jgi:hypothetical protein